MFTFAVVPCLRLTWRDVGYVPCLCFDGCCRGRCVYGCSGGGGVSVCVCVCVFCYDCVLLFGCLVVWLRSCFGVFFLRLCLEVFGWWH